MYYCSVNDVEEFLSLPPNHGINIQRYIELAESEIEALSYTCYAGKECISDLETHHITSPMGRFWWGAGVPIHTRHRPIRRILRFEAYRGGVWEDILSYEGRYNGHWWCDYEYGVCFVRYIFWWEGGREIRLQYVYGEDSLPSYVKQACILMASKAILMTERNRLSMFETTQTLDFGGMITMINNELRPLLDRIVGAGIPTGLPV